MINLILLLVVDISEEIDLWNMQLKIHFTKTIARLIAIALSVYLANRSSFL